MDIRIRPATAADLDTIVRYNQAIAQESEEKQLDDGILRAGVTALLADPAKGRYFIAEAGGAIVGQTMITFEWSDWRNGLFWWIQSVYVEQTARRQGVFSALFDHLSDMARRDPTVCGIRLYVERENSRAQQTYARCGLETTGYQVMEVDYSGAVRHQ
jgi:GNAT superfamily N-acetyltransferase